MKKIVLLAFVLALLSTAVVWGFTRSTVAYTNESNSFHSEGMFVFASSKTIWVPDNFTSIQEAVNNASDGDIVFVRADTYYENVVVNKTVSLIGENRYNTIIDANGTGNVILVTADNVSISGFTVTNAELKGIQVENSRYCEVHETVVCFTGDRGIVFEHGGNNTAYNNVVYNSSAYGGIEAIWSNNNTIYNNLAYFNQWGIATNHGSYNRIYNNTVYSNEEGILMDWPSTGNNVYNNNISSNTLFGIHVLNQANENIIRDNEISGNNDGIWLNRSSNNTVSGNDLTNNYGGIRLSYSSNNFIYHNNFVDNTIQVDSENSTNVWDDGYPSGGNWWSDYTGVDVLSGPYQNETGSDGIGDAAYTIDAENRDRFPLISTRILRVGELNRFGVVWKGETYYVDVISNSTVEKFQFKQSGKLITFNVTGPSETIGYCNVTIPKNLLKSEPLQNWTILVDGSPPTPEPIMTSNTTHTFLYFTYSHSQKTVEITGTDVIPEFPTWTSMLLILIVLTVAIAICKRRLLKTPIH